MTESRPPLEVPKDAPIKKYDWHERSMVVPPENSWDQHFNARDRPARYLDLRAFGSKKYQRAGKQHQPSLDRKKGGSQIEYADEEPIVREWFNEALARRGVQNQMAKHYEKKQ
jgi:hypothetical protein